MTEKNGIAQFMDKLMEGLGKMRDSDKDSAHNLPKPDTQEIGDGIIVWRWVASEIIVESILTTRENNQANMEKDIYTVGVKMPESENYTYMLEGDTAKEIGQAILSAWNWQHIWKVNAGEYLLRDMQQQELPAPEEFIDSRMIPSENLEHAEFNA